MDDPAEVVQPSDTDVLPVLKYGKLSVEGNAIIDQNHSPVQLRGMSLFWSQWMGKYYNRACVQWLRDDWRCNIIRAAVGVEHDGYLENPEIEKSKLKVVVDAAIELGMYVIIDWHDHRAFEHEEEAKKFFAEMAQLYGDKPNVIYELFNEPEEVSWAEKIKPYHESIIDTIRFYDADNLIICGTPRWSQDVHIAANYPIEGKNIVYALHFYAGTHKQLLRSKAYSALNRGVALMVTEFGTTDATGDGPVDMVETEEWLKFMDEHKLSWFNWSVGDKNENSAALKSGTSSTGGWVWSELTTSGKFIRNELAKKNPYIKE